MTGPQALRAGFNQETHVLERRIPRLLQVPADALEFVKRSSRCPRWRIASRLEAMIDVIVDQRFLGRADRTFDRVQLLRKIETGAPLLEHRDGRTQMTLGASQALDDRRVSVVSSHRGILSRRIGQVKQNTQQSPAFGRWRVAHDGQVSTLFSATLIAGAG